MTKKEAITAQFSQALVALKKALDQPKDEFVRDSAIQRFEFSFDLAWKTIKTTLEEDHGVICNSPKECFRQAYQQKIIEYDDYWLEITDLRNKTTHTYSEQTAEEIYHQLPKVLEELSDLAKKLS